MINGTQCLFGAGSNSANCLPQSNPKMINAKKFIKLDTTPLQDKTILDVCCNPHTCVLTGTV
jgi:hypothetical protein